MHQQADSSKQPAKEKVKVHRNAFPVKFQILLQCSETNDCFEGAAAWIHEMLSTLIMAYLLVQASSMWAYASFFGGRISFGLDCWF